MVEPIVVPRSEHGLSRRNIDPDALKVLYRLKDANYVAYLVGGSVRDLLLGRRPKDYDIGTSAHPYQVKRLFRNCWIIGRRFRLAHVKFGTNVIEVATFRRQMPTVADEAGEVVADDGQRDLLIHHDNTFGTPEEDAFRRDFSINALFYDIATFSIIDYVGGLDDLKERVVRAIGNPVERFQEDPVRMLRAVALAARLDFSLDPPVEQAIRGVGSEISRSAPARLLEEYYKILRAGASERTFRWLAEVGLLESITPELQGAHSPALWESLAELDAYRRRFGPTPERLTNAILLGSLLAPLGFSPRMFHARPASGAVPRQPHASGGAPSHLPPMREPARMTLGVLPLPRREIERLRQVLALQPRLLEPTPSVRAVSSVMSRSAFDETLTWLEIHGNAPQAVAHWRSLQETRGAQHGHAERAAFPPRRRRRRYRRPIQPQ
jgi:poly(A) polymerase